MAEDFSDSQPKVLFTLRRVTLPKLLPSLIYVTWKFGHKKGKTPLFRACKHQIEINESFTVEVPQRNKHPFHFAVFIKYAANDNSQLGTSEMPLPSAQKMAASFSTSSPIQSKYGDIVLDLDFEIKYIDKIDANVQLMFQKSALLSSCSNYAKTIQTMQPILWQSEDPSKIWGENGIFSELTKISHAKYDQEVTDIIMPLKKPLILLETQAKKCSSLISDVIAILIAPKPIFVNKEYQERICSDDDIVFPVVALRLAQEMNNISSQNDPVIITLVTLCSSFADFLKKENISLDWVLCILTTAFFVVTMARKKAILGLNDIRVTFDIVGRHALTVCVMKVVEELHSYCNSPRTFSDKMGRLHKSLANLQIPESIQDLVSNYVLNTVDFLVTRSWIMNKEPDFEILVSFNSVFPQFQFQLINALFDVINFSDEIISGQVPVTALNPYFRGQWLSDVLCKLIPTKNYQIDVIQLLPLPDAPSPIAPDITQFNEALEKIEKIEILIPDVFPTPK